ncbi:MAG: GNAT family N-acetyltransferase [Deltaproteobacteria bacterium]|nr:GNAT family N-acetyltransferase [Deltaproteobacteria bacterium]
MDRYAKNRWESFLIKPEQILQKLKPGMSIFMGSGVAEPRTTMRHIMSSNSRKLEDIEIVQLLSFGDAISPQALNSKKFRLKTFYSGWMAEAAISKGQIDFIPSRFVRIPYLIKEGLVNIDAAIIQVTPPNDAGYCSLGVAVDVAREAMQKAAVTVGEISTYTPYTFGDTFVHLSEFNLLVRAEEPPIFFPRWDVEEVTDRIACNVAALIEDESCVAFFNGPFFEALGRHLNGKKDLGIHSPFFTDALMELMLSGAVTNRFKDTHRGKSLTSYAIGTEHLLEWMDHNPLIEFQPIDKVINPSTIGGNPKFVSIIPADKIDLFGRVILDLGKGGISTGPSETMDLFAGAELSSGGHAIFELSSRDDSGAPNIRVSIADHPNQFTRYESVLTIVTEFGAAHLEGLTVRERAQALIEIAHPDDRAELVEKAKNSHLLYRDQIFLAGSAHLYPSEINEVHTFKEGIDVRFRPIKPSDEEGMRRFFYRFSDKSVYSRYFHSVRTMPHSEMQKYVNVDWTRIMSIVGLSGTGKKERIIAEGRYIRIPGTEMAEVVFIVDESYQAQGIATFLYLTLVRLAKERGVKTFAAEVLFSNTAMMKVFKKGNLPLKARLESGTYHVSIPLL